MMEYYANHIHANFVFKNKAGKQAWNGWKRQVDAAWASSFHTWAMEWNASDITLFLDGALVNTERVAVADGTSWPNPWRGEPVYMILNQALGGKNGGDPTKASQWPIALEVDYVRYWVRAHPARPRFR